MSLTLRLHLDHCGETAVNIDTRLVHTGRNPQAFGGLVNVPVCRGSTVLANSLEQWEAGKLPGNPMASYGRFGTATTRAFETAMAELEGGHAVHRVPVGSGRVHPFDSFDRAAERPCADHRQRLRSDPAIRLAGADAAWASRWSSTIR